MVPHAQIRSLPAGKHAARPSPAKAAHACFEPARQEA